MESKSNELISKLIEEPHKYHEAIFLLLKHLKNENMQYLDMSNSFGAHLIKKRQEIKKNWIKFWSAVAIIVCITIAITAAILLILSSLTLSGMPLIPFLLVSVPTVWYGAGITTFTLAPYVALCIFVIECSAGFGILSSLIGVLISYVGINKLHNIPDKDDNYILGFAEKMSLLLEKNNTLRELNLSGCIINEDGIRLIIRALKVNASITTLVIDSESISTKSLHAIEVELKKNKDIKLQNENIQRTMLVNALNDTLLIQETEKITSRDVHFNFPDFMYEIKNNLSLFNTKEANEKIRLVRDLKHAKKVSLIDLIEQEINRLLVSEIKNSLTNPNKKIATYERLQHLIRNARYTENSPAIEDVIKHWGSQPSNRSKKTNLDVLSEKRGYGFFQSSSRAFIDKLVPLGVLESRL